MFVALEMYKSFDWLFQIRGLLTVVKLLLVLLVPLFWAHRIWILLTILVIGSISSHMPGRFRYYSIRSGTLGIESKG